MNMKAVVRETGLKAHTIRAWERRYGLPQPTRSSGGHRVYSQRDVEAIKWLVARREQGMQIHRAVELWRNLEAQGKDPLFEEPYAISPPLIAGSELQILREHWVEACRVFDERKAEQILIRAFGLFPPETVCLDLILEGLAKIGEAWYAGEFTVQQEHFASELTVRRLEILIASTPPPSLPDRILVICAPGENHTISALMLTFLLRRRGCDALFMGANVPIDRFQEALSANKPRLVIATAQQLVTAASLLDMAHFMKQHPIPLAFGGRIFNEVPQVRDSIPAFFMSENLNQIYTLVEDLLATSPPTPEAKALDVSYSQALQHFIQRQPQVEASVVEDPSLGAIALDHLTLANDHLSSNIRAALSLGNLAFLGNELEWIKGLLAHHGIQVEQLDSYLKAYTRALSRQLDVQGQLIVDYLSDLIEGDQA
ncbi:MAG: MerR family transcriptional regulator [Anaerolineales bacterium]|nr:MerR family transcriptional regulator [Anaerolineales bacterium]